MSALAWADIEPDQLLIREYLRVSHDTSGKERSNTEQHDDNLAAIDHDPRWTLAELPPYRDVGSASRYATKRRGDYDSLIRDLAAGRFGADALMIWESSRGSRRVGEWVTLLELCAERSIGIIVTTHGPRLYDPTNDRDWRTLMEDAVDSEYETRKTSKRVRRNMATSAAAGKIPGGRRAFGYTADGAHLDPDEAEIVHECVRRVLAGDTVRSIAADLNRRGIRTSAGNDWHPGPLRGMLSGQRIAGNRTHHGRVVAKGQWPAIIDDDTHRRIVATLAERAPIGRRGRTPWVLTGFLRCGRCGAPLVGNTDSTGNHAPTRRYICRKGPGYAGCGGLGIKADPLEELLGDLATERLADVEARRAAAAGPDDTAELDELSNIAAMRIEASDDRAAGGSREAYLELVAALDRRQRAVETRLAGKVRTSAPLDFVVAEGYIGRPWTELGIEEQRLVLAALIDHVTVDAATTRGSRTFEPARVTTPGRIAWKI